MIRPELSQFGYLGCDFATGTGSITIPSGKVVVAITALDDSTFDNTNTTVDGTDQTKIPSSYTLPRGITIYGRYSKVELDSGTIVAYFGNK